MLWGVCKMLDLMETDKDFAVVFDYVCDVEVHFSDELEFYQIKTHGNNDFAYTYKSLTTKSSDNAEGSILGKLYVLNKSGEQGIRLALVSNAPYKSGKRCINDETFCFDALSANEKSILQDALCKELGLSKVDLSKVLYLHTDINLRNPEHEVQGKIVISFERIKHCEPQKPNALYRLIYDTVSERACYEFSAPDYESLLKNKAITKAEFDWILDCHSSSEKTGILQARQYIESLDDLSVQRIYKKSLAKLLYVIPSSKLLQELERKIGKYLVKQTNIGTIQSTVELLTDGFHSAFPIEYDNADKTVFYIIIIYKFVEGVYDNENDF